jgi:rhamnosyltransferase
MTNKKINASIVILTFNGEEFLNDLLHMATSQISSREYEVIVIDSGSKDGTIDIVKKYPDVELIQISNKEFGHGKTRNKACELAKGDYVLFLTQDAVPAHTGWLEYMLEPFGINDDIVCVFGKQIPRPDCFATLKREVASVFKSFGDDGSISLQRKTALTEQFGITNNFLSDANSAVRKSYILSSPFRDVNYAEDQALGIDSLAKGKTKAYAPLGSVYHSHNYPLNSYFKRKFDECVGLREAIGYVPMLSKKRFVSTLVLDTMKDYAFIFKDGHYGMATKLKSYVLCPFYNLQRNRAIVIASRPDYAEQKDRLSLEASARKNARK